MYKYTDISKKNNIRIPIGNIQYKLKIKKSIWIKVLISCTKKVMKTCNAN